MPLPSNPRPTRRREASLRLTRAAVLLAVGTALAATTVDHEPCEEDPATEAVECPPCQPQPDAATFAVSSTCGPAGVIDVSFAGTCEDDLFQAPAGPSVGLPDGGLLDYPEGGWQPSAETHVIQDGRFVFLGPVERAGAVRVDRSCRLTPAEAAGTFAFTCTGPQPQAACAGTLVREDPAP